MHRVAHLDLDVFALAHHTHVRATQLAQQVQRRLWFLAQGQTQRIVLATLPYGFVHVVGDPIEPIRRTGPVEPLVRTLVVVVVNPVLQPTAGVRERGEHGLLEKLPPDRLPEALDLAQRHRMLRSTAHMLHALLSQHLLEACLPTPSHELAAVVRENLAWRTPLADRALQHFEDRIRILLPEEPPARQVP